MKIICKDNKGFEHLLTIDKEYEVICLRYGTEPKLEKWEEQYPTDLIQVINDVGDPMWVGKGRFVALAEQQEQQVDQMIDEIAKPINEVKLRCVKPTRGIELDKVYTAISFRDKHFGVVMEPTLDNWLELEEMDFVEVMTELGVTDHFFCERFVRVKDEEQAKPLDAIRLVCIDPGICHLELNKVYTPIEFENLNEDKLEPTLENWNTLEENDYVRIELPDSEAKYFLKHRFIQFNEEQNVCSFEEQMKRVAETASKCGEQMAEAARRLTYTNPFTDGVMEELQYEEDMEAEWVGEQEMVDHPSHYNQGKIEVIDVIEDWNLDFHLGNTVKYIGRAGYKDDVLQELKKAKWYLERKIQLLEKEKTEKF